MTKLKAITLALCTAASLAVLPAAQANDFRPQDRPHLQQHHTVQVQYQRDGRHGHYARGFHHRHVHRHHHHH